MATPGAIGKQEQNRADAFSKKWGGLARQRDHWSGSRELRAMAELLDKATPMGIPVTTSTATTPAQYYNAGTVTSVTSGT